jgi:hypothetical protein
MKKLEIYMRITTALLGFLATATLLVSNTALPQSSSATFYDDVEISINTGASGGGFLRVAIQPQNGTKREATISITQSMGENEIAQSLADALRTAIGSDYEIDKDGGENVKIRKTRNEVANFSVEISFSAPGFSIVLNT